MADFSSIRINPPRDNAEHPPGDIDYPDRINLLIDTIESYATEVENSRESNANILTNLTNNYVSNTPSNNINGINTYKFTNMYSSTVPANYSAQDYVTKEYVDSELGIKSADFSGFNGNFTDRDSVFIVKDSLLFDVFDTDAVSLVNNTTYFYPAKFNSTYFLDWSTTSITEVKLDAPIGIIPVPTDGARLRFIFTNCGINDKITDNTYKIMNIEEVTFGIAYDHAIYEMVYTSDIGWYFTNVITGTQI